MKSSFLALPVELVTDSSLPRVPLIQSPPDFVWHTSDLPIHQVEEVGVPRVYFCESAAVLSEQQQQQGGGKNNSGTKIEPKTVIVMITFHQIVIFDGEDPKRLIATIELSCNKTKIHPVSRTGSAAAATAAASAKNNNNNASRNKTSVTDAIPFVFACYTPPPYLPSSFSYQGQQNQQQQQQQQQQQKNLLISFLDADTRNAFTEICQQVCGVHCNSTAVALHDPITPEKALDMTVQQLSSASAAAFESASPSRSPNSKSNSVLEEALRTASISTQQQQQQQNNNNNNQNSSSAAAAATCWRVSVLPWAGQIVQAPRDPAELLSSSLAVLIRKQKDRQDAQNDPSIQQKQQHQHLDRETKRTLMAPFQRLAASYEEKMHQLEGEVEMMRQSDERKLRAAEMTMQHALSGIEHKKDTVKACAVQYGEQLAEWLALLQSKQTAELDATVRLSQKKQEYAKALDDADAQLNELHNERRWIEAESVKFSAPEYVQLMARRDALVQALHDANRAVQAELRASGLPTNTTSSNNENNNNNNATSFTGGVGIATSPNNNNNNATSAAGGAGSSASSPSSSTHNNNSRSTTITTEASGRSLSLFSPERVIKMFSPPAREALNKKQQEERQRQERQQHERQLTTEELRQQQQAAATALMQGGSAHYSPSPSNKSPNTPTSSTKKERLQQAHQYIQTQAQHSASSGGSSSGPNSARNSARQIHRAPLPAETGLNKPVRIDQSVQQTLHVNSSLRQLLQFEREGAESDKDQCGVLDKRVEETEATLQDILNAQAVTAIDIQRLDSDNHAMHSKLDDLRATEQELLAQLNVVASQRGGHLIAAEVERDQAVEKRLQAEKALRDRKKETHSELFERTQEMLKTTMTTLAQSRSSSAAEN